MACIERRQHVGDVVGADGTDAQMAGLELARLVEVVGRFLLVGEQAASDVEKAMPLSVELDAPAAATNSSTPNSVSSDLTWVVTVGCETPKLARRGGEAAALGHGMEGPELGVPHIDFLNG